MNSEEPGISPSQWWHQRRKHYNLSLAAAGIVAFMCYAAVVFSSQHIIPDAEITIFTTLFQGVGYLIMIGIANLCFFAGPISERMIKPKDPSRFRTMAYRTGYWFSVLLPFCIPALLLYLVLFHPEYWEQMN